MPNPYESRGWPRVIPSERVTPVDAFCQRLAQLGASEEDIITTRRIWGLDPDRDRQLAAMDDLQLRREILSAQQEYVHDTTDMTDTDTSYVDREAAERIGGTIQGIMAWVGDNPERAAAILELERAGKNRKTLIGKLA